MTLHGEMVFPKLSRFDRNQEPCSLALPLPAGALSNPENFSIWDGDRALPCQTTVTSRWPDQSVRWLYVDFLANLPGLKEKRLSWRLEPSKPPREGSAAVVVVDGAVRLESGVATLHLSSPGDILELRTGLVADGASERLLGDCHHPFWEDDSGTVWKAVLDQDGWQVVSPGPIHAIVQGRGKHQSEDGRRCFDFQLRLHAYAGKPWFQAEYRLLHAEEEAELLVRRIAWRWQAARPLSSAGQRAVARSNYRTQTRELSGNDGVLEQEIDADWLLFESNEQMPETHYGTFWGDWREPGQFGLCLTVFQAQQNYPKALRVGADFLEADLYPASAAPLVWRQGIARTQRLLLYPHAGDLPLADANIRSLQYQMPDRPVLPASCYQQADVLENVWMNTSYQPLEAYLIQLADRRLRAYGMLHWGDAPDMDYTTQGRGRGKFVWCNNEYDMPHAAMLMYARNGERRMLDYLLVAGEHQMDVDVCHYSPNPHRRGAQLIHSADHVSGGATPSHQWVEGLLDLYHVTANRDALETALGIGENLLLLLQQPSLQQPGGSSARETGWALRSLLALYRETGEQRWLDESKKIVQQFHVWQEEFGAWLSPYTNHTLIRVPFMIAVAASSLMRYYWLTSDAAVGELVVKAMDDLLAHTLGQDGRFFYKELPSLQQRGAGLYVLESLAYAWDLTRDAKYIRAGMPQLLATLAAAPNYGSGAKYAQENAVIWERGLSPKAFAMYSMPLLMFGRAAAEAGLLVDDSTSGNA
ncbi:MAG: beta-L-arabinofuranosidase domain-containing protein [Lentisphaeria bacterium]|jgi:hypothetical protein